MKCDEAAILDCIGDGVMMIGLDMRVRYMNRAMRELLGYEEGEAQEMPVGCNLLVQGQICSTHDCIMEGSMIRTGHGWDHVPTESGFNSFKTSGSMGCALPHAQR